jgi:peroxiredoxin
VETPPAGGTVYYGELEFLGSVRFLLAIVLTEDDGGKATLYLDANRNGDFSDDDPASYEGTGTSGTAARMSFEIPRLNGEAEPYRVWLWTSFDLGPPISSSATPPGFNYYASCHKAGTLVLHTSEGEEEISVAVSDPEHDGRYAIDRVNVDWNDNGTDEDADWFPLGETFFYRGIVLTFSDIAPYADAVTFELSEAEVCPAGAFDVEADLALEPIVGNPPPELDVEDIDGELVSLEDYADRVLLIDFWATWCSPCLSELPNVKDTYEQYHDQGFDIVGVSLDSSVATLRTFLEENEITWRQICDEQSWSGTLVERYRVDGIPTMILVGRDGLIKSLYARGSRLGELVAEELAR